MNTNKNDSLINFIKMGFRILVKIFTFIMNNACAIIGPILIIGITIFIYYLIYIFNRLKEIKRVFTKNNAANICKLIDIMRLFEGLIGTEYCNLQYVENFESKSNIEHFDQNDIKEYGNKIKNRVMNTNIDFGVENLDEKLDTLKNQVNEVFKTISDIISHIHLSVSAKI